LHASYAAEWGEPRDAAGRKMMMASYAAMTAGGKGRIVAAAISSLPNI